jgi:hypothetical protein
MIGNEWGRMHICVETRDRKKNPFEDKPRENERKTKKSKGSLKEENIRCMLMRM